MLSSLWQDVRYALRALRKRPGYTAVTILVLAIAIGANTTVFSVLNGLFLRALPYPEGDRLVVVYDSYPKIGMEDAGTAIPDYLERRELAPSLESLALVAVGPKTLGGDGDPARVQTGLATPSLFQVLRTPPQIGRAFTESNATSGNDRVVILSDRLWRSRFAGAANVIGSDIRLDGDTFRVIGVMPRDFGYPSRAVDAWLPFAFTSAQTADAARGNQFSTSIGRLREGASIEGLNAELASIVGRNLAAGKIAADIVNVAGFTGRARALRDYSVGGLEPMVLILQALVLAVLLIGCANVANLQLARVAARRRELAVRAALGAASERLARLVVAESLVLAIGGALAGLALAAAGLVLVRVLGLDRAADGFEFRIDTTVLAFTLAAAVLAALVASLPPLIALRREDLGAMMKEAGRSGGGGRKAHALRSSLVVVQIAASVALLAGAGLLAKSFYRLASEGPGFEAAGVWTGGIALPTSRYATPEQWRQFDERALDAVRALPGVTEAGFTSVLPFSGSSLQGNYVIDGYQPPAGSPDPHGQHRSINEAYLPALGIGLIEGRNFERAEPDLVAIVDSNVARRYWPRGSALGQRIRHFQDDRDRWFTVVGVVPAVKETNLADAPVKETIYWHFTQRPVAQGRLVLRATLPAEQLTAAVRAAIAALDPDLALYAIQPLDALVSRSLGPQRAPMVLTLVFAAVALSLAVIGVYGMLTWAVSQRFAEIAVRLALGARASEILRMVLRQGLKLVLVGSAFGIVGAIVVGRALASQVRGMNALDPGVLALSVAALAGAALLASWLPARRAASTDPIHALRSE